MTAAIMNIDQGSDDGCCGSTSEGGCGNCILIQNPDSLHPDWSVMAMKKVCSFSFRFFSKRSTPFVLSYYCSKMYTSFSNPNCLRIRVVAVEVQNMLILTFQALMYYNIVLPISVEMNQIQG